MKHLISGHHADKGNGKGSFNMKQYRFRIEPQETDVNLSEILELNDLTEEEWVKLSEERQDEVLSDFLDGWIDSVMDSGFEEVG